ncbi:fasciclin-3 isoform X3 [Trichoplusia ni]|uniref:Fasciclin-3 isoform X3 n=1 Tax=Trichoplusia ni TaxID=7111 RepID=A0A7E5WHZ0_TRINI|nr:fasciclin-3 isoform X3 [Trichoplusia ni]
MAVVPAFFGLLLAVIVSGQNVEITPREAVVRVGGELTVLCKVPYPIDSCRITVGTTSYRLRPDNLQGDVVYTGQGLQSGECGALIKNILDDWTGNVTCVLPPQTGSIEIKGTMKLIVARPPAPPVLETPPQASFRDGDKFTAQCIVPDGRPAAKISWFLGEEELLHGVHQPILSSEPGSDLQTIRQNVSRTLTDDDDNKILVCRAEHLALERPMEAKRQLIVQYPPKRQEFGTITIFGLKLGAEGRLNVTVRANPRPTAEWTVGDQVLQAPRRTEAGDFVALEPLPLGNGFYNVTLIVARVAKEDVDRTYYLRVDNGLGREEFAVRISTMDEPAGVELDTGAIVGIVVGVLIVLIAVSLGVFAFATDRWCFAGRRRDNTKSSGESSDTESAVGGREKSRLAGLGARMRAVLPRAKDKVQATEAQVADTEEKPLSEDKKGVVYAELALGEQTSTEKPLPPSTEYAEIVYTDQPKDNKETN